MTGIRWLAVIGIPPLPRKVVANFTAADKREAQTELRRLIAIGAVPLDAYLRSQLEHEEIEREATKAARRPRREFPIGSRVTGRDLRPLPEDPTHG